MQRWMVQVWVVVGVVSFIMWWLVVMRQQQYRRTTMQHSRRTAKGLG
jgi:cyanate permease